MQTTLVTLGVVAVMAAIIGGGLKAAGVDIPHFDSLPRQVLLGVFGLALIAGGLWQPWLPPAPGTRPTETTAPRPSIPEPTETVAQERYEVAVPATQLWTATPVELEAGDEVRLVATGTIRDDVSGNPGRTFGPEGVPDPENRHPGDEFKALGFNHAALVGRIGEGGGPFQVGGSLRCRVVDGGRLYLGINDGRFDDNDGQYDVVVTVLRSPAEASATEPCSA